ncbi:MAG: hypothetical protein JSU66_17035 [Deltaproteobacteria bacterium]|nr:MAG: hypothetical protein JSU66_17035 [Deltaproteobacteria bacterium]
MKWIQRAALALAAVVVFLALLEGLVSLVRFANRLATEARPEVAERRHTRYDPELGWVNETSVHLEDFYGPGRDLTTNAQGFRGTRDVAPQVPEGRFRIVCSGDSFVLGYGVGDEDTWCAQLEAIDPRFEPVNMGQGGYGIDQAFLWYAREAPTLEHDLHVFAFIHEDFIRMKANRFLGYGKPTLALVGGELRVENVPVSRTPYLLPWLTRNAALLNELRLVGALRGAFRQKPTGQRQLDFEKTGRLALAVFERLAAQNRERGSALLLVYLPMQTDHAWPSGDAWRQQIRAEARRRGLYVVDLVERLRQLPRNEVARLFIPEGSLPFRGAEGHYTRQGNRWVAEQLVRSIRDRPDRQRRRPGPTR